MSQLEVDKIIPQSGTTLTLGDTGDTINFGSGVLPNFENLTVTGDLTVDTNSLKVDSANNRVGIGTATPSVSLDVVGAITASGNITGTLATAAQPNITSVGTLTSFTSTGIDDNADATAITINSSENVLVGDTSVTDASSSARVYSKTGYGIITNNNENAGGIKLSSSSTNALIFQADPNNQRASTEMYFYTDGSERMKIDTSYNLLVGDSSVTDASNGAKVYSKTGFGIITNNNENAGGVRLVSSLQNSVLVHSDPNNERADSFIAFNVDASQAMIINDSLNVGIGTSSPSTSLHISQSVPIITLTDTDTSVSHQLSGQSGSRHFNLKVDTGGSSGSPVFNLSMQDSIKLSVLNDGNVGIGTTTPSEVLHVVGDILATGGDFKSDANNYLGFSNNTFARFVINDSEKMRILSSGNVGIGTTSPASTLEISKSDRDNGCTLSITNAHTGTDWEAGDIIGTINFRTDDTSTTEPIRGQIVSFDDGSGAGSAAPNDSAMKFSTASSNTLSERMRIDSSGNVLIGDSNPDYKRKLTVSGNGSADTGLFMYDGSAGTFFDITTNAANGVVDLEANARTGAFPPLTFTTGANERMRIDSSGHVTKPSQPAVHAYLNTTQSNIPTGFTTVQLNAEIYDVNSDFNTSTYTFTAPVTGKYLVTMNLILTDVDTAFHWIYLVGVSSNRNYYLNQIDPRMLASDGTWSWVGSSLVDMDANDTFIMRTRSSAHGAAQMDIAGGTANATETTMTMTLLS